MRCTLSSSFVVAHTYVHDTFLTPPDPSHPCVYVRAGVCTVSFVSLPCGGWFSIGAAVGAGEAKEDPKVLRQGYFGQHGQDHQGTVLYGTS